MRDTTSYSLHPIGRVHSPLEERDRAPRQGSEGAPSARLEIRPELAPALEGLEAGQEILVLTWLHEAARDTLRVHPRDDLRRPMMGVFATRSADRPNPVGLHRVKILDITDGRWLTVDALEAVDGTPILDLKPVLDAPGER